MVAVVSWPIIKKTTSGMWSIFSALFVGGSSSAAFHCQYCSNLLVSNVIWQCIVELQVAMLQTVMEPVVAMAVVVAAGARAAVPMAMDTALVCIHAFDIIYSEGEQMMVQVTVVSRTLAYCP